MCGKENNALIKDHCEITKQNGILTVYSENHKSGGS